MSNDHELMRKTAQGDTRAFEQLVMRHQDQVLALGLPGYQQQIL